MKQSVIIRVEEPTLCNGNQILLITGEITFQKHLQIGQYWEY